MTQHTTDICADCGKTYDKHYTQGRGEGFCEQTGDQRFRPSNMVLRLYFSGFTEEKDRHRAWTVQEGTMSMDGTFVVAKTINCPKIEIRNIPRTEFVWRPGDKETNPHGYVMIPDYKRYDQLSDGMVMIS